MILVRDPMLNLPNTAVGHLQIRRNVSDLLIRVPINPRATGPYPDTQRLRFSEVSDILKRLVQPASLPVPGDMYKYKYIAVELLLIMCLYAGRLSWVDRSHESWTPLSFTRYLVLGPSPAPAFFISSDDGNVNWTEREIPPDLGSRGGSMEHW